MFIRQATTRSRRLGEPYFTYRLVESRREGQRVRQRTVLNLGRHFDVPREQWPAFVLRIEQIITGQHDLLPDDLDPEWVASAEQIAARVLLARASREDKPAPTEPDIQAVDINTLELLRPRSVGVEHLVLSAIDQLGLGAKLEQLGLNGKQRGALLGNIVARITAPRSERGTYQWLRHTSALGELLGFDYHSIPLMALYRATDALYKHKASVERFLYEQERSLFELDEVITLYDLTNTYFEGQAKTNANAARGHSKEKRSDCPLVTLAMVLDASGFPKRSEVLPGNVSEPGTLANMLEALRQDDAPCRQTVVLDAGIATQDNIDYLKAHGYRYLVVSRRRRLAIDFDQAEEVPRAEDEGEPRIHVQRVVDGDEVSMYCHSTQREDKDKAIQTLASQRYEAALTRLNEGLARPRTTKQYDKVLIRLGRLEQRYPRASRYYDIEVDRDDTTDRAIAIRWQRTTSIEQTYPGVYCLRSNQLDWDSETLWRTYTLLTDLEAVFRSLKSELGLRPVFHHKTERVASHLFLSVLAYHIVHTIRFQLKQHAIDLGWEGIRRIMGSQQRVTTQLKREDGRTLHVRKATRAEDEQRRIYDALGISSSPGQIEKSVQ